MTLFRDFAALISLASFFIAATYWADIVAHLT